MFEGSSEALGALSAEQVRRWGVLVTCLKPLTVLCSALDLGARDGLERLFGPLDQTVVVEEERLAPFRDQCQTFLALTSRSQRAQNLGGFEGEKVALEALAWALRLGASDLRFEGHATHTALRCRVDGRLYPLPALSPELGTAVISSLKVRLGMDMANRRSPQDGRASLGIEGCDLDLRGSSLPLVDGEALALRLLRRGALMSLEDLGADAKEQAQLTSLAHTKGGLVLVAGPTGSGKTTTQYALLSLIDRRALNVITLEDPVEYHLEGVNQVLINEAAGCDFASALRSVLRQDPDVVVVGEIRDEETARLALRLALTGHLVFSTVHTLDAVGALARLCDMGLERYLLADCLTGLVAQRLLRRKVGGGRRAVFEIYLPSNDFRSSLNDGASTAHLRSLARSEGCRSLREGALALVDEGFTTLAEACAATPEDHEEES